ncbi:unnamed protein product [Rhizophagus irregularis]|uniref:Uncharacterized protein n=1 Tax=Rhizophagus irregularis TaxID=588596 RepID=A0A2N1MUW2_9GLOM|nr:hypothetical protein RhiirC2_755075 [Rhizophagus irregularis]CAB4383116.1 unnamed protein product [Rhizophagus irregularis]
MHQLKINAAQNGIYWSGYKNLECLLNGSLQGFLIHTSTLYDKLFYKKLSDKFWLTESQIRAAKRICTDYRKYEYREHKHSCS